MLTPDSVSVPGPSCEIEPVPVMTFVRFAAIDWLKLRLPVTSMLPLRLQPLCSVNVLAPPVKVIALAVPPPLIEPLLMIVRSLPMTPAPSLPGAPLPKTLPPWMPPTPPVMLPELLSVLGPLKTMPAPPLPPLPPAPDVVLARALPPVPPAPPVIVLLLLRTPSPVK